MHQPSEKLKDEVLAVNSNDEGIDHNDDRKKEGEGKEEEDVDVDYVIKVTSEVGGPRGPEPTRYGDWERGGRCSDF